MDTCVVIGFLRGAEPDQSCLSRLLTAGEALVTSITVFELMLGLKDKGRREQSLLKLFDFTGVLPFDREAAETAAEIERALRRKGMVIGTRDTFIAAICVAHRLPLVTGNVEHFSRIPGLETLSPVEIRG